MIYNTIALISFVCILVADIIIRINSFIGVSNGSTIVRLALHCLAVIVFMKFAFGLHLKDKISSNSWFVFMIFMAWNILSLFRGALNAHDYWDYKALTVHYLFSILMPLAILLGIHFRYLHKTIRFILEKLFIFGIIFIPIGMTIDYELYSRVMMAVTVFLIFIPYLNLKWRVIIVVVAIISFSMDVSYRANSIRIIFSTLLLLAYYFRHLIKPGMLNFILIIFFCIPLLFLYLGIHGKFNIFQQNPFDYEYIKKVRQDYTRISNLSADTRTFLYYEVFHSMKNRGSSFIIGEGGGSAYETFAFKEYTLNQRGRYVSEVGFLNTLLYSGGVGIFLYCLMLFIPALYAINQSDNYLSKMLAIYLSFHWILFFVEDIPKMDMNFYFLWVVIGLCLSNEFRILSDDDIYEFLNRPDEQRIRITW
ncbi:hypothetical protein ACFL0S_07830 [Thermodesulfobacteriota bacterium]